MITKTTCFVYPAHWINPHSFLPKPEIARIWISLKDFIGLLNECDWYLHSSYLTCDNSIFIVISALPISRTVRTATSLCFIPVDFIDFLQLNKTLNQIVNLFRSGYRDLTAVTINTGNHRFGLHCSWPSRWIPLSLFERKPLMNERQHFEILLIEVMEMETVSVQQLQQQFCMGFNQAVRFMEYLSTHQMLDWKKPVRKGE